MYANAVLEERPVKRPTRSVAVGQLCVVTVGTLAEKAQLVAVRHPRPGVPDDQSSCRSARATPL
jgi:hypothetical protein